MKGLYSGRQILALKTQGKNITRSQTAVQAEKAIIRKYGSISPGGKYFHLGKGNWKKYSLESDQTRTGRLAPDLKTWREAPHKWDREGVDTKKEGSGKKKARVFSMTALKGVSKPITRKSIDIGSLQRARIAVKQGYNFKVGFEWTNNSKDRYRITGISGTGNNKNIKYINVAIPSKTYVTTENDLTFDLRMQKRSRKIKIEMKEREEKSRKAELEQKKKEEAEYQKKLEGLEGFETTLSKMNKPRAIELFNGFIRTNGKIKTRKDMIRDLIKAGYIVGKDKKGKTQLVKDSSVYDNLTKTEYNFAEYLIKKWKIKPKLSLSALKGPAKLAGRTNKLQPKLARYTEITPKTKVIITKAPKITIDQHFTKGKKSGSYAPTRVVNTPLEAFKIYMRHKDKYDEGLLFEAGPGSLTTAYEITTAARVDTPSVIYNAIIKKLNLDKYYAYLKYTDDPMRLKTAPLRTLSLRENWNKGAVL